MKKLIKQITAAAFAVTILTLNGGLFKTDVLAADSAKERKNVLQFGLLSMQTDIPIKIVDGRAMVPLRACSELLGATVTWNPDTRTATSKLGDIKVDFTIGSKEYYVNGAKKTIDIAPYIENGSTYIPLRYAAEGLGYNIDFKQVDTANIYIISEAKKTT